MKTLDPLRGDTDMAVTAGIGLACALGAVALFVWKLVIEPLFVGSG